MCCFAKKACTRAAEWPDTLTWWSWSARSVIVNATVTKYTRSVNGVSLPTDYPQGRVTVHGCTVRSPLTGCQVTSRPHDRFSRYSKWPDTFRTALTFTTVHGLTSQTTTDLKQWQHLNLRSTKLQREWQILRNEVSLCTYYINIHEKGKRGKLELETKHAWTLLLWKLLEQRIKQDWVNVMDLRDTEYWKDDGRLLWWWLHNQAHKNR